MTHLPVIASGIQREHLFSTRFTVGSRTVTTNGWLHKVLMASALLLLVFLNANAQTTWTSRYQTHGEIVFDVAYGAGKYVAVANNGIIQISSDGIAWTIQVAGSQLAGALSNVIYANGQFVAVGSYGHVRTSPDGLTWSDQVSGTTKSLNGIAYGGGRFIAVGYDGVAITSTDGIAWTTLTTGTSVELNAITYGNGTFVIVGQGGLIRTTPNGIIWTARVSGTAVALQGVTAGSNGQFVAVGDNNTIVRSPSGVTWTVPVVAGSLYLRAVTYDPVQGLYVAVAASSSHQLLRSSDGINWSSWSSGGQAGLYGVRYVNNQFIAVGAHGTISSSLNGMSWYPRTIGFDIQLKAVAYGNGHYVAVGKYPISLQPANGTVALTSTDGITYTLGSPNHNAGPDEGFEAVVFGNGQFVAVGGSATIQTSPDGKAWVSRFSENMGFINDIAYGGGQFVAVSDGFKLDYLRSPDGITWTKGVAGAVNGLPNFFRGITYANGKFVAVGYNGVISTTSNGVVWTAQSSGTTNLLRSVAYGNGTYVAVGASGTILRSADGAAWTSIVPFTAQVINHITFGNGQFVIVCEGNQIFTSANGTTWTARVANNVTSKGVTYGDGLFVAVGNEGSIMTSPADAVVPPANQPPIAPFIANTTGTVGQVYSQTIPSFTDPEGLPLTYSVMGLPPGLLVVAGGNMVGPPSTAGVYPITVTAIDQGGLSASASYTLTINPAGGGGFGLTAPLYNCQSGAFTFQTSGGNGSLIEYMAIGITGWTTNPNQFVDFGLRTATDAQPLTLKARQNGVEVTLPFNIQVFCAGVIPVDPPVVGVLTLLEPTYNCQSGAITFMTSGGNGSSIEYMAIGITGWTTNPSQFVDFGLRTATDAQPLTLKARQNGIEVTRPFNIQAKCVPIMARRSTPSAVLEVRLGVVAYPNPVMESLTVDIEGIIGQQVRLFLVDALGHTVLDRQIQVIGGRHKEPISLEQQPAGLYLLRVSTPGQTQTVKVLKP